MLKNNLKYWLQQKSNENVNQQSRTGTLMEYYDLSDIDFDLNDKFMIDILNTTDKEVINTDPYLFECSKALETYKDKESGEQTQILLPINTNLSVVSNIYKDIIDYTKKNNINLFDKTMKKSFYIFCKNNMS